MRQTQYLDEITFRPLEMDSTQDTSPARSSKRLRLAWKTGAVSSSCQAYARNKARFLRSEHLMIDDWRQVKLRASCGFLSPIRAS